MQELVVFSTEDLVDLLCDKEVTDSKGIVYVSQNYVNRVGLIFKRISAIEWVDVLKVIRNEKQCIEKQCNSLCDNLRDCANCDLALPDETILSAYDKVIDLVQKHIRDLVKGDKQNEKNGKM